MNLKPIIMGLGESRVKLSEPLANHTYFKIGGPADALFEAAKSADLIQAVQLCLNHQVPYFVLGGGSNILVGDKGFRGLVIKNRADNVRTVGFHGKVNAAKPQINQAIVEADSGTLLNKLVRFTVEEGLGGLEVFLSVPGSVGGGIYNNSHYRPEEDEFIGNLLYQATIIDQQGNLKDVPQSYFKFNYDYSILQDTEEVVIKASFILRGGNKQELWQLATDTVKRRNQRQPIGIACSGCTFRNPSQARSAGYLIDQAGLKNAQVGQARVSPIHASFIENLGGATAKDVLELIDKIKTTVYDKFSVKLELEIFLVGEF